eukprot:UC1_evm2s118
MEPAPPGSDTAATVSASFAPSAEASSSAQALLEKKPTGIPAPVSRIPAPVGQSINAKSNCSGGSTSGSSGSGSGGGVSGSSGAALTASPRRKNVRSSNITSNVGSGRDGGGGTGSSMGNRGSRGSRGIPLPHANRQQHATSSDLGRKSSKNGGEGSGVPPYPARPKGESPHISSSPSPRLRRASGASPRIVRRRHSAASSSSTTSSSTSTSVTKTRNRNNNKIQRRKASSLSSSSSTVSETSLPDKEMDHLAMTRNDTDSEMRRSHATVARAGAGGQRGGQGKNITTTTTTTAQANSPRRVRAGTTTKRGSTASIGGNSSSSSSSSSIGKVGSRNVSSSKLLSKKRSSSIPSAGSSASVGIGGGSNADGDGGVGGGKKKKRGKEPPPPPPPTAEELAREAVWEANADLRVLCEGSLISRKAFVRDPTAVLKLEAFFGVMTCLDAPSLAYFTKLRELTLVSQPALAALTGLEACPNLEILRVCECALSSTRGVRACTRLREAHFFANAIDDLADLDQLGMLRILNLDSNRLSSGLGSLPALPCLEHLSIRNNGISRLHRLQQHRELLPCPCRCVPLLKALTSLDLAANDICDARELAFLQPLPALTSLRLGGHGVRANPICNAPDYLHVMMGHLPLLQRVDDLDVKKAPSLQKWLRARSQRLHVASIAAQALVAQAGRKTAEGIWYAHNHVRNIAYEIVQPAAEEATALRGALAVAKASASCGVSSRGSKAVEVDTAGMQARLAACEDAIAAAETTHISPYLSGLTAGLPPWSYFASLASSSSRHGVRASAATHDELLSSLASLTILGGGHISVEPAHKLDSEWFTPLEEFIQRRSSKKNAFGSGAAADSTGKEASKLRVRLVGALRLGNAVLQSVSRRAILPVICKRARAPLKAPTPERNSRGFSRAPDIVQAPQAERADLASLEYSLQTYAFYLPEYGTSPPSTSATKHSSSASVSFEETVVRSLRRGFPASETEVPTRFTDTLDRLDIAQLDALRKSATTTGTSSAARRKTTCRCRALVVRLCVGDKTGVRVEEKSTGGGKSKGKIWRLLKSTHAVPEYLVDYEYEWGMNDDEPTATVGAIGADTTPGSADPPGASSSLETPPAITIESQSVPFDASFSSRASVAAAEREACTVAKAFASGDGGKRIREDVARALSTGGAPPTQRLPAQVAVADGGMANAGVVNERQSLASYLRVDASALGNLTVLNLARAGIRHLPALSTITPALEKIHVGANRLSSVGFAGGLGLLRTLDLACNAVTHVRGLRGLRSLALLDLSHNALTTSAVRSMATLLSREAPKLSLLDLRGNPAPVIDEASHTAALCTALPALATLNGCVLYAKSSSDPTDTPAPSAPAPSAAAAAAATTAAATNATASADGGSIFNRVDVFATLDKGARLKNASYYVCPWATHRALAPCGVEDVTAAAAMPCTRLRQNRMKLDQPPCNSREATALCLGYTSGLDDEHTQNKVFALCPQVQLLCVCKAGLRTLSGLVSTCINLVELDLSGNQLESLSPFSTISGGRRGAGESVAAASLRHLERLNVSGNCLTSLDGVSSLPNLRFLVADDNERVTSLSCLASCAALSLLSVERTGLVHARCILPLRTLSHLDSFSLSGSPAASAEDVDDIVLHHLSGLAYYNGWTVTSTRVAAAHSRLAGLLTEDIFADTLGEDAFAKATRADLGALDLRRIQLRGTVPFFALHTLNLEDNSLRSFAALGTLPSLTALCLNGNRVSSLHQRKSLSSETRVRHGNNTAIAIGGASHTLHTSYGSASVQHAELFPSLELLFLANNGLHSLVPLKLQSLPRLRALYLHNNDISSCEGLHALPLLSTLVLDRNRIREPEAMTLSTCPNLSELRIDNNRVRTLREAAKCKNLRILSARSGLLCELEQVELLASLTRLQELCLCENAVARNRFYRPALVIALPSLCVLDDRPVSDDDRFAAEDLQFQRELEAQEAADIAAARAEASGLLDGATRSNGNGAFTNSRGSVFHGPNGGGSGGGNGVGESHTLSLAFKPPPGPPPIMLAASPATLRRRDARAQHANRTGVATAVANGGSIGPSLTTSSLVPGGLSLSGTPAKSQRPVRGESRTRRR